VVAPDQRGYGRSDHPEDVDAYTILHLVGDVVGLIQALGEEKAYVVGHDWGAPVAWHTALLRPAVHVNCPMLNHVHERTCRDHPAPEQVLGPLRSPQYSCAEPRDRQLGLRMIAWPPAGAMATSRLVAEVTVRVLTTTGVWYGLVPGVPSE
jgi:pimeloyl-ACP methyl ester carboxylesterase